MGLSVLGSAILHIVYYTTLLTHSIGKLLLNTSYIPAQLDSLEKEFSSQRKLYDNVVYTTHHSFKSILY